MPSCPGGREAQATVVPGPQGPDIALSLIWFCEDMESSGRAERKDVTDLTGHKSLRWSLKDGRELDTDDEIEMHLEVCP
jgi:hypothetical protein